MKKLFSIIFFLIVVHQLNAQPGVWTAVKYTSGNPPFFGIQGVPDSTSYPPPYGHMGWTDLQGNFWLFGGMRDIDTTQWSDLWKYETTTNQWTWIKGWGIPNDTGYTGFMGVLDTANRPGYANGVTWVGLNGDLWLLQMNGRLWKYEIISNTWTWMNGNSVVPIYGTKGTSAITNTPGFRKWASSWTDSQGNLMLFGGNTSNLNHYNDLWKYDISINEWTWIGGSNIVNHSGYYGSLGVTDSLNLPHSRSAHTSWLDTLGNLWVFGGSTTFIGNCYNFLNDLWKLDTSNIWTWISGQDTINSSGNYGSICIPSVNFVPSARTVALGWVDSTNNLWLYGGIRYKPLCYGTWRSNDLWKINTDTIEWTLMDGSSTYNQIAYIDNIGQSSIMNQPGVIGHSVAWKNNNEFYFQNRGYSNLGLGNVLWKYTIIPNGCQTTSINQAIDYEYFNISLYPNPTYSELNIQFTLKNSTTIQLQLFNSHGQVVKIIAKEKLNAGENKINISTVNLRQGVYYLKFNVGDKSVMRKVVKM